MRITKYLRYTDTGVTEREGEVLEVNGNLTLIRDIEDGVEDWYAPHEVCHE